MHMSTDVLANYSKGASSCQEKLNMVNVKLVVLFSMLLMNYKLKRFLSFSILDFHSH